MTKHDLQDVRMVVGEAVAAALQPINNKIAQLDDKSRTYGHALFGVTGVDGINKEVSILADELVRMKLSNGKIIAMYSAAAGIAGFLGTMIGRYLFN